jgi:hypothetical protein
MSTPVAMFVLGIAVGAVVTTAWRDLLELWSIYRKEQR